MWTTNQYNNFNDCTCPYHLLMFSSESATYITKAWKILYGSINKSRSWHRRIISIFIKSKISKLYFKKYILHNLLFILFHTSGSHLLSIHPHVFTRTIKKKKKKDNTWRINAKTHRSIKKRCIVALDEFAILSNSRCCSQVGKRGNRMCR